MWVALAMWDRSGAYREGSLVTEWWRMWDAEETRRRQRKWRGLRAEGPLSLETAVRAGCTWYFRTVNEWHSTMMLFNKFYSWGNLSSWKKKKRLNLSKIELTGRKLKETKPTGTSSHKSENRIIFIDFLNVLDLHMNKGAWKHIPQEGVKYTKFKPN